MAENIRLEVVTPEKYVVSEAAKIVMAPGTLGEFGVLSGHTPFMSSLKTGAIRYEDDKGSEHFVFVSGGFVEALPDRVTVLADSKNTATKSVTAFKSKITGALSMKASYKVEHDSHVPADTEKTDTETALTLVYDF